MVSPSPRVVADLPYLIAMALLEQDGQRAMPLQGQSLREAIPPDGDPGDVGRRQAFELLLRVWQRSDGGPLRRVDGDSSLLLAELPIASLMVQLPELKAEWLNGCNTSKLIDGLEALGAGRIWTLKMEPRSPLTFERVR